MDLIEEPVAANTRSRCASKRKVLLKGLKTPKRGRKNKENMHYQAYSFESGHIPEVEELEEKEEGNKEAVIVLRAEEILKSEDPFRETARLKENLHNPNWLVQYENIDSIRKLCLHHKKFIENETDEIIPFLQESAQSLRSAQSRNALLAFRELYKCVGNKSALLLGIDKTLDVVLAKSVNDKRFLALAAGEALEQIAVSAASLNLFLSFLRYSNSRNNKILSQIAKCSLLCIKRMDLKQEMKDETLPDIVAAILRLESSKSVEAKKPAQSMLRIIFKSRNKDDFHALLKSLTPSNECSRLEDILTQPHLKKKNLNARKGSLKALMMQKRQEMQKTSKLSNIELRFRE